MTETRSYQQNCSLALSLDLLGERWTLLIVRELARGPKRFGDLKDSLAGIGATMLAARLRRLELAGVVARVPPGTSATGYALTERGERLAEALGPIMLWGLELDVDPRPGFHRRAAWLAMNMQARLRQGDGPAPEGTFAFAVDDERFYLHVGGDRVTLRDGSPPHPADSVLTATSPAFYALATGVALEETDAGVEGDRDRLRALLGRAAIAPGGPERLR